MPDRDTHRNQGAPHPKAPTDELVLAAMERAARHRARDTPAVPIWAILEHLDIRRRSAHARVLRSRLERLTETGTLECTRRRGVSMWALSAGGLKRLQAARLAGAALQLPESPQHLAWRHARTTATQEIERLRQALSDDLGDTVNLLDRDPPAHSDAWFELAQRLQRDARRVGSASHCLYEWAEPHDSLADIDEHRQAGDEELDQAERAHRQARRVGRRNVHLWQEGLC